jgi:hypothetical protein
MSNGMSPKDPLATFSSSAVTDPPAAPLLIIGSPRSGTTFLSRMVSRFFDVHVCRDNGTLVRLHGQLSHYEPLSNDANCQRLIKHLYADHYIRERLIARGLTLSQQDVFARLPERTYSALIATIFGAIATERGKGRWGYKRASLARMTGRHFNDIFPDARIVHIIRDARDVALSMRRTSRIALERSFHFGALDWTSHVSAGRSIGQAIGASRYLEVHYEQLMEDPAATLTRVFDFSGPGSDRDARTERIHAELPQLTKKGNTDKWRTQIPADGIRQIERVAGATLRSLGYDIVNPDAVGAPIGAAEMAGLYAERVMSNLLRIDLGVNGRYRLEVLKERWRARLGR